MIRRLNLLKSGSFETYEVIVDTKINLYGNENVKYTLEYQCPDCGDNHNFMICFVKEGCFVDDDIGDVECDYGRYKGVICLPSWDDFLKQVEKEYGITLKYVDGKLVKEVI